MTPDALARLQARAYTQISSWSARDFAALLAQTSVQLFDVPHAFLLARIVADEAEILALATDPDHQRRGLANQLLATYHTAMAQQGVTHSFLEVAATGTAARALYDHAGYAQVGLRKDYYRQPDGRRTDAVVMARAIATKSP